MPEQKTPEDFAQLFVKLMNNLMSGENILQYVSPIEEAMVQSACAAQTAYIFSKMQEQAAKSKEPQIGAAAFIPDGGESGR